MKTYKYTSPENLIVHVIDEDGKSRMSCLASSLEEGTVIEAADPPGEKEFESAIDAHINAVAHSKGWESRTTCALRSGYTNPWQTEAIAFGQWMDSCYLYCQQAMADVLAGTRTIPTIEELISELPAMVWPE